MKLNSATLGTCEVEIYVDAGSAVDSYILRGYGEYGFDLSEDELDLLQKEFEAEVQAYAWDSGRTRNHN